jgi:hypothetical protein
MKTHSTLIPTRFMCSILYLVAAIMVFSTSTENVLASLPKNYAPTQFEANRSVPRARPRPTSPTAFQRASK